jgi:DNA-binding IclR family transcriptional regulator
VLRTLAAHSPPLSLATIAQETGLPKSTVKRLLATLESIDMIERQAVTGAYTLGPGIDVLTGRPTSTAQLIAVVHPYLSELVDTYGEDAGLAVPDVGDVLLAHQVASPNPVQVQNWTGTRIAPHIVAAGHVMMSGWTDEELDRYLAQPLTQQTERTLTDPEQLRRRIASVRTG